MGRSSLPGYDQHYPLSGDKCCKPRGGPEGRDEHTYLISKAYTGPRTRQRLCTLKVPSCARCKSRWANESDLGKDMRRWTWPSRVDARSRSRPLKHIRCLAIPLNCGNGVPEVHQLKQRQEWRIRLQVRSPSFIQKRLGDCPNVFCYGIHTSSEQRRNIFHSETMNPIPNIFEDTVDQIFKSLAWYYIRSKLAKVYRCAKFQVN